jgi:hypothetical protein
VTRKVTAWRIVPLATGVLLAVLAAAVGSRLGVVALLVAVVFGAMWPQRAAAVGALVPIPLAIAALVRGALHSVGWFALALVASPFAIAMSAGAAILGSYLGHALGRASET